MEDRSRSRGRGATVFVAGATGAVGRALLPRLLEGGYDVIGMTRSLDQAEVVTRLGATGVVCDVFDPAKLQRVMIDARPDVIINQLTDLPQRVTRRPLRAHYPRNDRVRREGTENLLAVARTAGGRASSVRASRSGTSRGRPDEERGRPAVRDRPVVRRRSRPDARVLRAHRPLRWRRLRGRPALRVYGPRTWYAKDGDIGRRVRRRRYPIVGSGEGVYSFVHVDDAAPATADEWLPVYAEAVGAKRPIRVPEWAGRLAAGTALATWATTSEAPPTRR